MQEKKDFIWGAFFFPSNDDEQPTRFNHQMKKPTSQWHSERLLIKSFKSWVSKVIGPIIWKNR